MAAKRFIIYIFTACLLLACSEEVSTVTSTDGTEKVPVSIRIVTSSSTKTKSGWEYDNFFPSEAPTEEESQISNILLVVFKDELLEEYDFFDASDFPVKPDGSIELTEGEAGEEKDIIDLAPGLHYFYIILNLPDGLYEQIETKLVNGTDRLNKETFEKEIINSSIEYLTKGEKGFILTNSTTPTETIIYTAEQIKNSNGSLNNRVTLQAGRAVGKVSLAYTPTKTGEQHGRLSDIRYKVLNNPSQMYLMPVTENNILISPHYTSNPNTSYFSPVIGNIKPDDPDWLLATTTESQEKMDFDYCIENSNKTPRQGNTSMLLIEAKFHPVEWLNTDGTPGDPNPDGTFYRIVQYNAKGNIVTYWQGYYNNKPSRSELPNIYCEGIPYVNGICYYPVWLTYENKYVVKRNAYYRVAITHIHAAGSPNIPGTTNPDIDVDDKYAWGRLAVFSTGWDEHNHEETLGNETLQDPVLITDKDIQEWEEQEQDQKLTGDNNF